MFELPWLPTLPLMDLSRLSAGKQRSHVPFLQQLGHIQNG